ncbi:hypothetical protein [Amycolatopsis sp. NPDC059657]|uniref:hypothetical protein n=1 Tax=Amycolatopsis sp. NPDC059657 TaxID=3346899 RepID=UPI00366DD3D0
MAELIFGNELKKHLDRWPTKTEIHTVVRAAIAVSDEEQVRALPQDQLPASKGSFIVGDITVWAHEGNLRDRDNSVRRWRDRRMEIWRELMASQAQG